MNWFLELQARAPSPLTAEVVGEERVHLDALLLHVRADALAVREHVEVVHDLEKHGERASLTRKP